MTRAWRQWLTSRSHSAVLKFIAGDFPNAEADRLAAHAVRRDIFIVMANRGVAWGRVTHPSTPERYERLAEENWDSAYRNTALTEREQSDHTGKGLQAINEALRLNPDYPEVLLYKVMLMKVPGKHRT